jgi:hypothetical protein
MTFKLTCPKCASTDYSIERDRRIRTLADPAAGLIFSCRCGKQLFGSQVVEVYKRQQKAWEAGQVAREKEKRVREETLRRQQDGQRPYRDPVTYRGAPEREHAEASRPSPSPQGRTWLQQVDEESESAVPSEEQTVCAWHPCQKPARPGSKYCCRACSNKNARWRYKQRKVNEREAA